MKIRVLKFTLSENVISTSRQVLDFTSAYAFEQFRKTSQPVILTVLAEDVVHLSGLNLHISFIGKKNQHKGLSHYFLSFKNQTVPLLQCNYTAPGKLVDGVRKYLTNAETGRAPEVAMVSILSNVFGTLWALAAGPFSDAAYISDSPCKIINEQNCAPVNDSSYLLRRLSACVYEPPSLQLKYIGEAESVQLVRKQIVVAARIDIPAMILGDTGTGKEIVAREIHNLSKRSRYPFKAVNCGAISKELLEVELFGCEKDVTGPGYPARTGVWEAAGRGTLFLDEIGDLSLDHQVKILRALQENKIRRVGSTNEIPVYARIVAASNKNLFMMAQSNLFRFDLYYRLNGIPIKTPRLRDHPEDIGVLAHKLWKDITLNDNAYMSRDIVDFLEKYPWPGNVRELKMVLSGLFALYQDAQPALRDMQDAFIMQGLCLHEHTEGAMTGDPIRNHRARCLQHLKKTYEVLHGLLHEINAVGKKITEDNLRNADGYLNSAYFLLHELGLLTSKNSYYLYKTSLIQKVRDVYVQVKNYIREDSPKNTREARVQELQATMAHVSEAIEMLLKEAA
jgi:DNA-binding NtrC family response regulator